MLGFRLSKKNNLLILVSFDFLKQIHQQVTPIKPSVGTKEWFNLQIFEVSSAIALQLAWQSGDGQKGKGFHDLKDHLGKTTALSICISLHLNLHIYIYNHTYLQKIISAYVYICLHIHLYIYVYIYIYIHIWFWRARSHDPQTSFWRGRWPDRQRLFSGQIKRACQGTFDSLIHGVSCKKT